MVNKKVKSFLLSAILLFSCLLMTLLSTPNMMIVHAANIEINGGYSDVLEDLQDNESFNPDEYEIDQNDFSLNFITLAESSDREVFVYVYQPCTSRGIVATTINLSTGIHKNLSYKNYKLKLINQRGVFYKYLVEDLAVSDEEIRYYEISSIYRKWDGNLDDAEAESGTISEVPFAVAKQYILRGYDDNISYSCNDVDVITVTDKYVGFVRYDDGYTGSPGMGFAWHSPGSDSHFIAFSTDKPIDKLMEADVFYTSQSYYWHSGYLGIAGGESYGEIQENYAYPTYKDRVELQVGHGFGYYKYSWDRIQTVDEFIATEDREFVYNCGIFNVRTEVKMTDEGLQDLKGKDWVIRFAETEFSDFRQSMGVGAASGPSDHIKRSTIVGDVTILRLQFETDGIVYNLGVVDNKMTGDGIPDNYTETTFELTSAFKTFIAILLFIVLLLILWPVLPYIFMFFGWLLKGLWKIITLPFKAFKSSKKDKRESQHDSQQEKQKTDKKKK